MCFVDDHPDLDTDKGVAGPAWVFSLMIVALVAVTVGSVVVIVRQRRQIQQLLMTTEVLMNGPWERRIQMERLSPPSNVQAV